MPTRPGHRISPETADASPATPRSKKCSSPAVCHSPGPRRAHLHARPVPGQVVRDAARGAAATTPPTAKTRPSNWNSTTDPTDLATEPYRPTGTATASPRTRTITDPAANSQRPQRPRRSESARPTSPRHRSRHDATGAEPMTRRTSVASSSVRPARSNLCESNPRSATANLAVVSLTPCRGRHRFRRRRRCS